MAKKKAANGDGSIGAFASAIAPILNPKLQVHQIYASAFEDAVNQINGSLQPAGSLVATIRARAAELDELADLIETTLAAKEGTHEETHEETHEGMHEGDGKEKNDPGEGEPKPEKGE